MLTSRTFLAALISLLFIPSAIAEQNGDHSVQETISEDQCIIPENTTQNDSDIANTPVSIEADNVEVRGQNEAVYQGDVKIKQGQRTLTADTITVNQGEDSIIAQGNVQFTDGQLKTVSAQANSDLKGEKTELHQTQYKFLCQAGRGEATYILKDGQTVYKMEDGSLTTCPEDNHSWRIKASAIDIDNDEQEATFYHTRFEVLDVPIVYWPYITVPIGDQRKTGFLFPGGGYDTRNGAEISIPIYFNLAPNYDLITTVNYMEKRGVQLNNEFRYLTNGFGRGGLDVEYLNQDQLNLDIGSRWAMNYYHNGIYQRHWKFEADYSRASDIDYFTDMDSSIGNREDGQLLQSGEVAYRTQNATTSLKVRDFQVMNTYSKPYRLMPQLGFTYYRPNTLGLLDLEFDSHISNFKTDDDSKPDATRVHLAPGVILPLSAPWGQLTTEAKVMYSYYQQNLKNGSALVNNPNLEDNVQRVVPEFRIHGSLFMDRSTLWLDNYTQSLEPQLQYLYIPEIDQTNIYSGYDTTLLQTDYYGLFRSQKYSSVDYIAAANQFSYGATSRFYDSNFKERFNIALGQIFYLNRQSDESDFSAWALDTEININSNWQYKGDLQYDIDLSKLQIGSSTIEYRVPGRGYSQLNYRYVTKDYIQANAPDIPDTRLNQYTRDGISQVGFLTGFNINRYWDAKAQYFHDLTENVMLESLANLTYTDDCWFFGLTYSHHIVAWDTVGQINPGPEYESKISVNVGLRGLGKNLQMTYSDGGNALGYSRPFSLNN